MEKLKEFIAEKKTGGKLENFNLVDCTKIIEITDEFHDLPKDYISFLEKVGSGGIKDDVYMLFDGIVTSDELYDDVDSSELSDILFFGDDLQGYCNGFDSKNNWIIVEVDPTDMSCNKVSDSFIDFMQSVL